MKLDFLTAKQTKYGAYVALYTAVVVAALGVTNFLANRHNKSWDATANKKYSLSDQTIKLVKELKQDVKLSYVDQALRFRQARDLLDRYDSLSTKLSVDYVDYEKSPLVARALNPSSAGSVIIQVGAKKEEAKSISEEEITGALIRALKEGTRTVCAVTGSGEHRFDDSDRDGYAGIKDYLERNNYKTRDLSLLQKAEVPKDCTVLLVGGPTRDYAEPAVNAVKSYVEGGGRALIMLDPPLKFQGSEVDENAALAKVIEGWGVTLLKDVVVDPNPLGQLFGLGALAPLINNYESHAIVREMKGTASIFPFTRALEVKSAAGSSAEKLCTTSDQSFDTVEIKSEDVKKNKDGPFAVAAAGTQGTGKPEQQGRFVITGTSQIMTNAFLRRGGGNRDLAMNMFNWLSQDEDLISIRPKEPDNRPLQLSRAQMSLIFYASVIGFPLLVVFAGIGVWWKRR